MRAETARTALRTVGGVRRTIVGVRALPPPVRRFRRRAWLRAVRAGDRQSLRTTLAARDLRRLIDLSTGRRRIVEIGTSTAWTALSLLLVDAERTVVSYDVAAYPQRSLYFDLVGGDVLERLRLVQASGLEPGPVDGAFDLAFLDANHHEDPTARAFEVWSEHVVEGGLVVFDDHDERTYPGVVRAVARLGLEGHRAGRLFVWSKPASG
jgi:predicted O-methyltransferase YrrM